MSEPHKKIEKPPPPEYRTFTEALSSVLSVSKPELQQRLDRMKSEKVSRYKRYKYVPAKPQS
jgi:Mn-dependent DtxR family transcriptional regulator